LSLVFSGLAGVVFGTWVNVPHVSLLGVKELKLEFPRLLSVASWVDCGKREG